MGITGALVANHTGLGTTGPKNILVYKAFIIHRPGPPSLGLGPLGPSIGRSCCSNCSGFSRVPQNLPGGTHAVLRTWRKSIEFHFSSFPLIHPLKTPVMKSAECPLSVISWNLDQYKFLDFGVTRKVFRQPHLQTRVSSLGCFTTPFFLEIRLIGSTDFWS